MGYLNLIRTKEPHFVPGYTGHCPQYDLKCGETYGTLTHKLLTEFYKKSSGRLLNDPNSHMLEGGRSLKADIDLVNTRNKYNDSMYQHPMLPGYQGFIPRTNERCGETYGVQSVNGLSHFIKDQTKRKASLEELNKIVSMQSRKSIPQSLNDRLLLKSQFKLPLEVVRPECVGVRGQFAKEPWERIPYDSPSPYFMKATNPQKYFISGYTGHIPFGCAQFGATNVPAGNAALCQFTDNYRRRQNTEWAPAHIIQPEPPLIIQPTEIYHRHVGLVPNYTGHVPGETFRTGVTFGRDTVDAKRYLLGDS